MKKRIAFFIVGLIAWMLLTWSLHWQNLAAGVVGGIIVALLVGDLFVEDLFKLVQPRRYFALLHYIPVFLWEMIKANLDVAYRVAHPALPIKPGIVKVRTKMKSDTGLTVLANSITLTPGTMSVDVDQENGFIYVHWINVKETDVEKATQLIVSRFEKILTKVFE